MKNILITGGCGFIGSHLCRQLNRIYFMKSPQNDPRRRKPDIRCARELLGWSPAVTLNEGLEKMIAFYQRQLN